MNIVLFVTCIDNENETIAVLTGGDENVYYRVTSLTLSCFSGTLEKVICPVYTCSVAYTGKVTFQKLQEKAQQPCIMQSREDI